MARTIGRLTALMVGRALKPGMYSDGAGLYLRVTPSGTKNWVYRYMLSGKPHWMGIGPLHTFGLTEARARTAECRKQRHDGVDPIAARQSARAKIKLDAARNVTFGDAAKRYIAAHQAGWRNAKHAAQWTATIASYAEPEIGALPVQSIDTTLIMKVLEPVWQEKPETATRLRGRIEAILDWATARGYRSGENPARWRGHLENLLPARSKVRRVEHHAALPYANMAEFMAALRAQAGTAARALEFAILAAARSGEVIGAQWSEVNIAEKVWVIPAERMKGNREHRVPLSAPALIILRNMASMKNASASKPDFVFPGGKRDKPLSNMAFLMLLRRMGYGHLTAHGFRSSFRDWAAEATNFPSEVAEMALAHAVGSKVEAAYWNYQCYPGDSCDQSYQSYRCYQSYRRLCLRSAPIGKAAPTYPLVTVTDTGHRHATSNNPQIRRSAVHRKGQTLTGAM